jgi:hypothetical protein
VSGVVTGSKTEWNGVDGRLSPCVASPCVASVGAGDGGKSGAILEGDGVTPRCVAAGSIDITSVVGVNVWSSGALPSSISGIGGPWRCVASHLLNSVSQEAGKDAKHGADQRQFPIPTDVKVSATSIEMQRQRHSQMSSLYLTRRGSPLVTAQRVLTDHNGVVLPDATSWTHSEFGSHECCPTSDYF